METGGAGMQRDVPASDEARARAGEEALLVAAVLAVLAALLVVTLP